MDSAIRYLNTDLDLRSDEDLTPLAASLESAGVLPLHVVRDDEGFWHARFEAAAEHPDVEATMAAIVTACESLAEPERSIWSRCSLRELDIGLECGTGPWGYNQAITGDLLGRVAALGLSLRITLYPAEDPATAGRST